MEKFLEGMKVYSIPVILILIGIFAPFKDFFASEQMRLLMVTVGVVSFSIAQILINIEKIKIKLEKVDSASISDCPFSNEGIKVITDTKDYPDIFSNFTGIYYALNAPLRFETSNLEYQVQIHANRYKQDEFYEAHYYYPVFSLLDEEELNIWVKNIYKLFYTLNKQLNHKERNKIIFHVPLLEEKKQNPNQLVTYFFGQKNNNKECVMYIHNKAFSIDTNPKHIFIINNKNILKDIKEQIEETENQLDPIKGIPNFILYLEKMFPKICQNIQKILT